MVNPYLSSTIGYRPPNIRQMPAHHSEALHSEAFALDVARRMGQLLAEAGTPPHQQATLLAKLCELSASQARRKLQGAHWSIGEVLAVARHCGASLDALFPEVQAETDPTPDLIGKSPENTWLNVQILLGAFKGDGEAQLGNRLTSTPLGSTLVARQGADGWVVGTAEEVEASASLANCFIVNELLIHAPSARKHRVAVLDDDRALSESLAEWLAEAGFETCAFTSASDLLAKHTENPFEGFIVDYLLAGGSSQEVIQTIRQSQPQAPILLLTGKLRSNQVSEAELMGVLRTHHVTFFEKPVRPGVLAAALFNGLDQWSHAIP